MKNLTYDTERHMTAEEACLAYRPFEGDRDCNVRQLSNKLVKTRKLHICQICFDDIPVGSVARAMAEVNRDENQVMTFYFCVFCCNAMVRAMMPPYEDEEIMNRYGLYVEKFNNFNKLEGKNMVMFEGNDTLYGNMMVDAVRPLTEENDRLYGNPTTTDKFEGLPMVTAIWMHKIDPTGIVEKGTPVGSMLFEEHAKLTIKLLNVVYFEDGYFFTTSEMNPNKVLNDGLEKLNK